MKILLIGSGGREHALAWFIAPGNAGTNLCGENIPIKITEFDKLAAFCLEKKVDMVFVGPEEPLVKGIYDFFKKKILPQHIFI